MKKAWIFSCVLALVATAGFAQAPAGNAPVTLAAILEPAGSPGSCPAADQEVSLAAAVRRDWRKATCIAQCDGTTVSCSYTPPSTCTAVDRNCAVNQRGYVNCNGVTTYCPTACGCTAGTYRYVWTGFCCDQGGKEKVQLQCINGQWQDTGVITCGGICGPQ